MLHSGSFRMTPHQSAQYWNIRSTGQKQTAFACLSSAIKFAMTIQMQMRWRRIENEVRLDQAEMIELSVQDRHASFIKDSLLNSMCYQALMFFARVDVGL